MDYLFAIVTPRVLATVILCENYKDIWHNEGIMHVSDIQIARRTVLCQMEPTTVNVYGERRVLKTIPIKMVNSFC